MVPALPKGFTHPMAIGGGAFATVYRARQSGVERWVAVKLIARKDSAERREMLKEATVQAQIRVNCIPQVFDAFEWKKTVCIVMQWIKGTPLAEILLRSPSPATRLWLADCFVRALAHLHEAGFAHRDLKPANIVVSPAEGLFLVDFSFTKNMRDIEKSVSGVVKGTPAYMAPELWRCGGRVDHMRADVYSAGIIIREILGDTHADFIAQTLVADNPEKRPASCAAFLPLWRQRVGMVDCDSRWPQMLNSMVADIHSQNLLAAAKELMGAGRYDEAYGLLVECIEENPDRTEAVQLMGSFSSLIRRRAAKRSAAVAAAAAAAFLCIAGVLLSGREDTRWRRRLHQPTSPRKNMEMTLMKTMRAGSAYKAAAGPFKADSLHLRHLTGSVFFKTLPAEGELIVDGRRYGSSDELLNGISLPFGMHTMLWRTAEKKILWRERVRLLPFQRVGISVTKRYNRGGKSDE